MGRPRKIKALSESCLGNTTTYVKQFQEGKELAVGDRGRLGRLAGPMVGKKSPQVEFSGKYTGWYSNTISA